MLINEIHPNPESGSEWIEFYANEQISENFNLNNYTIFDSYHQIYKFSNEKFSNQILVVEVSGLNNDQDSVILKDPNGNIIDSFSYTQTQKGFSFARSIATNIFAIETPSRNQTNPEKEISISPSITATNSSPTDPSPSSSSITQAKIANQTKETDDAQINLKKETKIKSSNFNYDLNKIQLLAQEKEFTDRRIRLVFLGQNQGQVNIINAIIGSSLVVFCSFFLLYVKIKNRHH